MQREYRKKAGITVFLTMLLAICGSFLFALLETARVKGLHTEAQMVGDMTIESMFAEYQKSIYEEYGILLLDESYQTGKFDGENLEKEYIRLNDINGEKEGMYSLKLSGCEVEACQYVTDYGGAPFRRLAVQSRSPFLTDWEEPEFEQEKENYQRLKEENQDVEEALLGDFSACNQYEEEKNQINIVAEWSQNTILSKVIRDESLLSSKAISLEDTLEHRKRNQGNIKGDNENAFLVEKKLFADYLEEKMGSYTAPKEDHALDYEWEYILAGKSSDKENLAEVSKSLIKIRELSNIAYLVADAEKCMQAQEAAVLVAGWSQNPAVVELAKWGILNAWAYQESVLDVRALLEGEKISFLKNSEEWTLQTVPPPLAMSEFYTAKNCEQGWDYVTYLKFLLYIQDEEEVNYRSMDIIEANISKKEGIPLKMDHMVVYLRIKSTYEAEPLFWNHIGLDTGKIHGFTLETIEEYSYL